MSRYDSLISTTFQVMGRSGDERICKCPWHNDGGKPNLYVNASSGLYYCHACGAKGSIAKGVDREVLVEADLRSMRDRLSNMGAASEKGMQVRPESWLDQFDIPHEHWTDVRRFSEATIARFRLGYDPGADCLTIPIRTSRGEVLGVIRRRLDGEKPKYKHPTGFKKSKDLFGSWLIRKRRYDKVAVVEGPLDAVACWDARIPAVALHGAHMADGQAAILRSLGVHTVVTMTDNDRAGDDAVHTIKDALPMVRVLCSWYRQGWGKDPGELTIAQRRLMFNTAVPYHRAFIRE